MGNNEPKNTSNELNNAKESNDRVKENILIPQNSTHFLCPLEPFEKIEPYLSNISKSILKIVIDTRSGKIIEAGFLLKFYIGQELFYCLISNEHVIKDDIIKNNNIIIIYYDNESKNANIKLKNKKRYIKSFIDIGLDIKVIEILDEDNISKNYFLFPESEIMINKRLINNGIYILQYAKGKGLVKSRGKIKEINKYEITHLASTQKGSSGRPIFLENCINIIGIHKEGNKDKTENYGDFIYPVINIIENDIKKKRNSGKYINGKYIWEDDKYYYIGEFKNNLPNGKGTKYYLNGKILYEDNFINGKFEGNGKYYYDDGIYYIGQYKNGLRHGKGIEYYSNENIMYEGEYINGKREGKGKYIWENGEYYIGQFKNGSRHGKGIKYYSNGNIKYEGDWINGKREGNGKFFDEDGNYYIGQFKDDLRNGKGKVFLPNGIMIYDGIFINDKSTLNCIIN